MGPFTTKSRMNPNLVKSCLFARDFLSLPGKWITGYYYSAKTVCFITIWKIYTEENSTLFSILTIQPLNLPRT